VDDGRHGAVPAPASGSVQFPLRHAQPGVVQLAARAAQPLGGKAWLCFEDEAGQGLRLPKGRTWGRRGRTPLMRVSAAGSGRISLADMICTQVVDHGGLSGESHWDHLDRWYTINT
jgi:hypothetical protein